MEKNQAYLFSGGLALYLVSRGHRPWFCVEIRHCGGAYRVLPGKYRSQSGHCQIFPPNSGTLCLDNNHSAVKLYYGEGIFPALEGDVKMGIEFFNISKAFGDKVVLSNVNFTFAEGSITCVMGPSGIGKTTLANILAGLIKPDSGELRGVDNKKVAFVFQEDRLLDWESTLTNVLFVMKRADKKRNVQFASDLLVQAGLGGSLLKKARFLSGGMKRRVAICRALASDYDLLILDEPFKGLDRELKPAVINMIKAYTLGKSVVCITHDDKEAMSLGSKIVFLDNQGLKGES